MYVYIYQILMKRDKSDNFRTQKLISDKVMLFFEKITIAKNTYTLTLIDFRQGIKI